MSNKLAECLLRRKELQMKLDRMQQINNRELFETKAARKNVTESIDDVIAQVPKLTYAEFEAEYRFYAKRLRLLDAAIQQANWTTEVVGISETFEDYEVKAS